jgi:AcrR family transcriptional regulator
MAAAAPPPPPLPVSSPPKPARLTGDQRRSHFLDTAAAMIAESGAESVTMEGVAARAGVSKALGYRYFANRDELLIDVFDREMQVLDERVARALASETQLEGRLRATIEVWLDLIIERGALLGSLQRSKLIEGPVEERRLARIADAEEQLARFVLDDHPMPHDDALLVAAVLLSGADGALRLWIEHRWSRRYLSDHLVRIALGAIEALAP